MKSRAGIASFNPFFGLMALGARAAFFKSPKAERKAREERLRDHSGLEPASPVPLSAAQTQWRRQNPLRWAKRVGIENSFAVTMGGAFLLCGWILMLNQKLGGLAEWSALALAAATLFSGLICAAIEPGLNYGPIDPQSHKKLEKALAECVGGDAYRAAVVKMGREFTDADLDALEKAISARWRWERNARKQAEYQREREQMRRVRGA